MKKIILLALLAAITIASCKKEKTEEPTGTCGVVTNDSTIVGRWQWLESNGGMAGNDHSEPAAGEFRMLSFYTNNTYENATNGQVTASGTYTVALTQSMFTGNNEPALFLDGNTTGSLIKISNNILTLTSNTTEPVAGTYKRLLLTQ